MSTHRLHACALAWALLVVPTFLAAVGPAAGQRPAGFHPDLVNDSCETNFTLRATLKLGEKPARDAEARLAFHWQADGSGYYLSIKPQVVQCFRVEKGAAVPLNAAYRLPAPLSGQITVSVKRRGKWIRPIVDGVGMPGAADTDFPGGKAGFWSSDAAVAWQDVRCQNVEPVEFSDDFMRRPSETSNWQPAGGQWAVEGVRAEPGVPPVDLTANPFTYRGTAGKSRAASLVGYWFWDSYSVAAAAHTESAGAVGLAAYYQGPDDHLVFRWTQGLLHGKRQILLVQRGKEKVLAEAPGGYETGQWYWLELRAQNDEVQAFIDRQPVLKARTPALCQGRCGLVVEGQYATAQFDDVRVSSAAAGQEALPFPQSDAIPERFVTDQILRKWATEEGAWDVTAGDASRLRSPSGSRYMNGMPLVGTVFQGNGGGSRRAAAPAAPTPTVSGSDYAVWHRGEFFSEPTVTLNAFVPAAGGKLWVAICAPERSPAGGYRLELQPAEGRLACALYRKEKQVATGQAALTGARKGLVFRQDGARVTALLDGQQVATYEDPAPLHGTKVGYGGTSVPPLAQASATCAAEDDFTFSAAPARWRIQRGVWDTEPHWGCTGRGAHLMGMDLGMASLWSKERFGGDQVVEAFITNAELPTYVIASPRHLNFTLCGDGVNPASGYTFLFGGSDGRSVRILRSGKEVSRRPFQLKRSIAHNMDVWFYVRIEKLGQKVSISVDGDNCGEFTDPQPLDAGYLSLWTYGTGTVLGRVRVWRQRLLGCEGVPAPVLVLARAAESAAGRPDAAAPPAAPLAAPLLCDFETGLGPFTTRDEPDAALLKLDHDAAAGGRRSLLALNRDSGGGFAAWALSRKYDLSALPVISFDYKVPADVKVNLYAHIGKAWEEITFTGKVSEPVETPSAPGYPPSMRSSGTPRRAPLGAIEGVVADDKWHHARFNLAAALKGRSGPVVVEGLAFASPEDVDLRCGIGGNPFGVAFHVDNFQIGRGQ